MMIPTPLMATSLISLGSGFSLAVEKSTDTGFDPLSLIGTTLTPVIVILLLLTGKLHTDGELKRLQAEADSCKAELTKARADHAAELNTVRTRAEDKMIPALAKTTLVLETVIPLLTPSARVIVQSQDQAGA